MADLLSWLGNAAQTGWHDLFGGGQQQKPQGPRPTLQQAAQQFAQPGQSGGLQVRPVQQPQLNQQASTPAPQPLRIQPVQQPQLQAPVASQAVPQQPLQVHVATPPPLQMGNQTFQPTPGPIAQPLPAPAPTDLLHNPVTNFVGTNIVKPLGQFPIDASNQLYNRAVAPALGTPKLTPQQVTPIAGLSNAVGADGSLHQMVGSGIQTALTIGTGGLGNIVGKGVTGAAGLIAPKLTAEAIGAARLGLPAASGALNTGIKYGTNAVTSAAINSGFGAASAAGANQSPGQIVKAGAINAGLGLGLGVGGTLAADAAKPVIKAVGNAIDNRLPVAANQIGSVGKDVNPTDPLVSLKQEAPQHVPDAQTRNFALLDGDFKGAGYTDHHGVWVDNAISNDFRNRITPEAAANLKAQGITTIEKGKTATGVEYGNRRIGDQNHGVIKISDENQFKNTSDLAPQFYHESGHHIWSQKMTPEDKAAFSQLNPTHTATHAAHEHAGRIGGEMDSESFSDYVAMELQGKGDQIPAEVRPIVQKYTVNPKQQLTDLYNQAHAEAKPTRTPIPQLNPAPVTPKVTAPTGDLGQSILKHYTPSANPTAAEQTATNYLRTNPSQAMHDYNQRVMSEFGVSTPHIVAGDEGKYILPGATDANGKLNPGMSTALHEPGSALAKAKYDQLLADPATKDKPVMIMAGGTGAGKTSALKKIMAQNGDNLHNYAAVIDTNSNKLESTQSKILAALDSGRTVKVMHVHRDPVEAFQAGVIPRSDKIGRTVPLSAHIDTHLGSRAVTDQLHAQYADHPNVLVQGVDNSRGYGNQVAVPVDKLPKMSYNSGTLRTTLERTLNDEHAKGNVTKDQVQAYLGQETPLATQAQHGQGNGTRPPNPDTQGQLASTGQVRGFTTSVKNSPNYTPELKKAVDQTTRFAPISDASAIANADAHLKQVGVDQMHREVLQILQGSQRFSKQDIVNAGTVLDHLDNAGRTAEAQQLHELIAKHGGTEGGQQVQAFATILKRNPNGILHENMAKLTQNGIPITPKIQADMNQLHAGIKAAAPNSIERAKAVGQMDKYVASHLPSTSGDKLFALWRSGLLTGARTLGKIVTSHTAHSVAEGLANIPAAAIDRGVSLVSGKRSGALTAAGTGKGFAQGARNAGYFLKTGIEVDPHTNISEFRKGANFGINKQGQQTVLDRATHGVSSKVLNTYTSVGRLHGAIYQPFNNAFRQNELESLARAYAHNEGVPAAARAAYIRDFVAHPPSEAAAIAKQRGDTATFQQETALGNIASTLQQKGGVAGKVIAPFTRIPSAIATDVFNYSPAGAVKTIIDGIRAAKSTEGWTVASQRAFSQGLGRSIVGAGAMAVGIELYNKGIINLGYPTDPKVQKLWQQEGRTPNSVLIGGKWRSLGSFGPVGAVLEMGSAMANAKKSGDDALTATYKGLLHGAQAISEQSYLAGTNAAVNAIKDPGRYGGKLVNQYAGSVVPTLVSNTAQATDKFMRRVDNPLQAIQNNIPGAREKLPAKIDAFGQPVPTPQGGNPLAAVDPFYSYNVRNANNPMTNELQRLQNQGQGAMPATIKKVESFGNASVKLNPDQVSQLQQLYGQGVQKAWQTLMGQQNYQNANDIQKQSLLSSTAKNVEAQVKAQFAAANADQLNKQVAKPGTTINQAALDAKNKPYTPPVPKDPNAKPKVTNKTTTTYNAQNNTWTQTSSKTGRTVTISADGTRTVTNAGVRAPRARRSGGVASSSGAPRARRSGSVGGSRVARSSGLGRMPSIAGIKAPRAPKIYQPKAAKVARLSTPKFGTGSTRIKYPSYATGLKAPKITSKALA